MKPWHIGLTIGVVVVTLGLMLRQQRLDHPLTPQQRAEQRELQRSQELIDSMEAFLQQERGDALCAMDLAWAKRQEDSVKFVQGYGPVMRQEHGGCYLANGKARWRP